MGMYDGVVFWRGVFLKPKTSFLYLKKLGKKVKRSALPVAMVNELLEMPTELVLSVLLQLRDLRAILCVEGTCTLVRRLIQQHQKSLLNSTHAQTYGLQPLTGAVKDILDACQMSRKNADDNACAVAVRVAIANGVHVNALYPVRYGPPTSPLLLAVHLCRASVVRELLLAGADPNMITYDPTRMPPDLANPFCFGEDVSRINEAVAIVNMLLRTGASEERRLATIACLYRASPEVKEKWAPLFCALKS